MRLSKSEIEVIRSIVSKYDTSAKIYLFGSRVFDNKRGGDIDLLIFSDKLKFDHTLKIKVELKKILGDQRIDIIIAKDKTNPFVDLIYDTSIRLL
jgi:predicted nucleotidyltransferase